MAGGSRRPHTKSRAGCKPCKTRRIKPGLCQCDRRGPICTNCERRKVVCEHVDPLPPQSMALIAPIAAQTGRSSALPQPSLQFCEIDLIHHWTARTSLTMGADCEPETVRIWHTVVPRLAQSQPFLMHGILAMSAAHIANQDATKRREYLSIALRHHNTASSAFRQSANDSPGPPNPAAALAFATITMLIYLALLPKSQDLSRDLDSFISWILFLRRSVSFAKSFGPQIGGDDEVAGIISHRWRNGPRSLLHPDSLDGGLIESLGRLGRLCLSLESPADAETMTLAVSQTKLWFRLVPIHPQNFAYLVLWVASMSDGYFALLQRKNGPALALLAHWIVPLYHAPRSWFLGDWPERAVAAIGKDLGVFGIESIAWVMKEVDITPVTELLGV